MSYEMIIFDLDGTIINSEQGFVASINYALKSKGFAPRNADELRQYIGPSLEITFPILTGNDDEKYIEELLVEYRVNYARSGYQQVKPYDGMVETIEKLHAVDNVRLGVCTSKRTDFAIKNLELVGLIDYFEFVSGAGVGLSKSEQLTKLLADGDAPKNSIMVGDRLYDMRAAQNNQLDKAGVLWGFGSADELNEYSPQFIFNQPSQLLQLTKGSA